MLRLLHLRDGEVKEAKEIVDANQVYQKKDERVYVDFIIKASRLKPQWLSQNQYKALLRAYFLAKRDPRSLEGPVETLDDVKCKDKLAGLKILLQRRKDEKDNGLSHVMRDPLSVEMNTRWLWSLVRQGKIKEAVQAH
jgi:hypothetical protein